MSCSSGGELPVRRYFHMTIRFAEAEKNEGNKHNAGIHRGLKLGKRGRTLRSRSKTNRPSGLDSD